MNGREAIARALPPARTLLLAVAVLVAAATAVSAKTNWRSVKPRSDAGKICLQVESQDFEYCVLDAEKPALLSLRGPRRLKIVTRYLFSADDPEEQSYTLRVLMDGREVLRKSLRGRVLSGPAYCDQAGEVGALRKVYVDVPTGQHEIQVLGGAPPGGNVAARFFRESRQQKTRDVAFAPESFDAVYHLQFASGKQSTYYHFSEETPLRFTVKGPTNLKIYTRLDFDHTMNGDQNYSLELLRGGESQNVYHYHASKLSAAAYRERPDILPGDRKLMRISVPPGVHRFEIRCVRPEACGISCQIRIPEADVKP